MRTTTYLGIMLAMGAGIFLGCSGGDSVPPDEALARVREYPGGEFYNLGKGTPAETWEKAAYEYYPPAELDYFEDMDGHGVTDGVGVQKLVLSPEAIKGR